ncbi:MULTISPECIES: alpha/beta hydrolase-fold protein [unclassified Aeromicrobium]|uniref:alpha/beta hydrolase-fold protein n=1 Tax=unclassified Aeromicrobium TaxID=2633570 RepID=UPI00396B2646
MSQPPKVPRPSPVPRVPLPERLRDPDRLRAANGPVIDVDGDSCVVTFVRDAPAATAVLLFANRLTDESDPGATEMERVGAVGPWALSVRMASTWRASYAFLVHEGPGAPPWRRPDGHVRLRALLDRGLPDAGDTDRVLNRAGTEMSVVSLPHAPAQPWRGDPFAKRPPAHRVAGRDVWVHRVGDGRDLPVVVLLDGEVWLDHHGLHGALDLAHESGALPAHVAVFVASGSVADRWADVGTREGVTAFVASDLLPWLHAREDVSREPDRTVVAGQSLGGMSALWAVALHPDRVGVAVAQSASLWKDDPAPALAASGGRVLLDVGLQEWTLLPLHRRLAGDLAASGARVELSEFDGGHDYACWRGSLIDLVARALSSSPHA